MLSPPWVCFPLNVFVFWLFLFDLPLLRHGGDCIRLCMINYSSQLSNRMDLWEGCCLRFMQVFQFSDHKYMYSRIWSHILLLECDARSTGILSCVFAFEWFWAVFPDWPCLLFLHCLYHCFSNVIAHGSVLVSKTTKSPHILAHINIVCPGGRYLKLNFMSQKWLYPCCVYDAPFPQWQEKLLHNKLSLYVYTFNFI